MALRLSQFVQCPYQLLKSIPAMISSAAMELGQYGVTVNALLPGLVDTPLTDYPARFRNSGRDLVRVNLELFPQLGKRPIPLDRRKRHLRLEGR